MTCKVEGKIKAFILSTGEELRRWGGKECFLTHESDLGPVLVVKTPSTAIGKGTFYSLPNIKSILGMEEQGKGKFTTPPGVKDGKLTIFVDRQKHKASLQISCEGEGNIKNLQQMTQLLGKGLFGIIEWTKMQLDIDAGRKKKKGGEFNAALKIRKELQRRALREQLIETNSSDDESVQQHHQEEGLDEDSFEIKRPKKRNSERTKRHLLCDENLQRIEGDAPTSRGTSTHDRRRKAAVLTEWLNDNYHVS